MTRKHEWAGMLLLAAALLPATGCFSAVKHAYYELRGAKGTIEFIQRIPAGELEHYKSYRFEPVTSTLGPELCPAELRSAYDRAARELATELSARPAAGEATLTIASEILYFQKKGLFGDAELLARLKFTEGDQKVGDALVVVGSKAFREGGANPLAEAALKTIGKYLREGTTPEEERERKRKEK